jgi:hypothetical protein
VAAAWGPAGGPPPAARPPPAAAALPAAAPAAPAGPDDILRRIDAVANQIQSGALNAAQVAQAKRELALLRAAEARARAGRG